MKQNESDLKDRLINWAKELGISTIEKEFYRLDPTETVDAQFDTLIIDFDEVVRVYCSEYGIRCDTYKSADGLYFKVVDGADAIYLIETKSFEKYWENKSKHISFGNTEDEKIAIFEQFIADFLDADSKVPHKPGHMDQKITDSYLMLLSMMAESYGRMGCAFVLSNQPKKIRFVWYIPGYNGQDFATISVSMQEKIVSFEKRMKARFRSLASFAVISDEGVRLVFQ